MPELLASDTSTNGSFRDLKAGNLCVNQLGLVAKADSSKSLGSASGRMPHSLRTTSQFPDTEPSFHLRIPPLAPQGAEDSYEYKNLSPSQYDESTSGFYSSTTDVHKNTTCASSPKFTSPTPERQFSEVVSSPQQHSLLNYPQEEEDFMDANYSSAEDSTIDDSWRPAADKRRILAETMEAASNGMMPPMMSAIDSDTQLSNRATLDTFLDSIILDAREKNYYRVSPGVNYRKRAQLRGIRGSTQSVGSALDGRRAHPHQPARQLSAPMPAWDRQLSSQSHNAHEARPSASTAGKSVNSRGSRGSRNSRGSHSRNSNDDVVAVHHPQPRQAPIAWSRKEAPIRTRRRRPTRSHSTMDAGTNGGADRSSEGTRDHNSVLRAFLDRESKHARPTAAHTISGDPRAADSISIAISDGGDSKTFKVGPSEAKIIQKLLEASKQIGSPQKMSISSWLQAAAQKLQSPSQHDTIATTESTIIDSERVSTRSNFAGIAFAPNLEDNSSTPTLVESSPKVVARNNATSPNNIPQHTVLPVVSRDDLQELDFSSQATPSGRAKPTNQTKVLDGDSSKKCQLQIMRNATRSQSPRARQSSESPRIPRSSRKNQDHDQEKVFSPRFGRPTNRRSMMKKMHSVPVLPTEKFENSQTSSASKSHGRSRISVEDSEKIQTPHPRTPLVGTSVRRRCLSANMQAASGTQIKVSTRNLRRSPSERVENSTNSTSPEGELTRDVESDYLQRSFLDQYLDGKIEGHDSASNLVDEVSPIESGPKSSALFGSHKDASRPATTLDRRSEFRKAKSVNNVDDPSPALLALYVPRHDTKTMNLKSEMNTNLAALGPQSTIKETTGRKSERKKKKESPRKKISKKKSPEIETSPNSETLTKTKAPRKSTTGVSNVATTGTVPLNDVKDSQKSKDRLQSLTNSDSKVIGTALSGAQVTPDGLARKKTPTRRGESSIVSPKSRKAKSTGKKRLPTVACGEAKGDIETNDATKGAVGVSNFKPPNDSTQMLRKKGGKVVASATPLASSASKKIAFDDALRSPPPKPIRKLSRPPDQTSTPEATTQRPNAAHLTPAPIAEGSILEVPDDSSVYSDVTDMFSLEPIEPEPRRNHQQNLSRIDEAQTCLHGTGASWADLSISGPSNAVDEGENGTTASALSRNRRMHVSRRWQSSPNMGAIQDMLISPSRGACKDDNDSEKIRTGRFRWMKRLAFMKPVKTSVCKGSKGNQC